METERAAGKWRRGSWSPEAGKVLGTKAQIQFSAGSLSLNDVPATNVLIEGSIDNDRVTLTNLGADIARGTLTGNAQRNADGSWQVENLRMADIRLQSEKSLTDFFAPLRSVPSLQIGRLEVIRCSFARSGLGGDRPRSQLAQHDLQ